MMHRSVGLLGLLALGTIWTVSCRPGGPTSPSIDVPIGAVTLDPESGQVPVDGSMDLSAVVLDDQGDTLDVPLRWSSSDTRIATVDDEGVVTGRAPGSITISASVNGVTGSASVDVRGFLVGPGGGTARSTDGRARLEVPAGALSDEAVLNVETASGSDVPDTDGFVPGSAYRLETDGSELGEGARLIIRYDPGSIPGGVQESSLRLRRADGEQWRSVSGSSVDVSADEVRGDVDRSAVYGAVGVPPNQPPQADIDRPDDGDSFRAGEKISFHGTGQDPEDGKLDGSSLVWRSDRDGQLGTGEKVDRSDLSVGTHEITLTVTDSQGARDTERIEIEVTNTPPEVQIDDPDDGDIFVHGRGIQFEGEADDPEDGDLKGDALVWKSSIDGEFGTGEKVSTNELSEGEHTITLTATDSHGAEASDQIRIRIVTIF